MIKYTLNEKPGRSKCYLNFASRIHLVHLGTPSRNDARWVKSDARCLIGMQDGNIRVYIRLGDALNMAKTDQS